MKIKYLIAMLLVLGIGYPVFAVGSTCVDSSQVMINTSICDTECLNYTSYETCDYGCDATYGRCKIIDSGYGLMTTLAILAFIMVSFWLSHALKRKEAEEEDVPKATLSLVFMLLGMIGLLGLFVYVGGLVSGYDSSFLQVGAGMMSSLSNIWAIVLMVFPMIIVVFFLIRLVRERLIDKRR